MARSLVSPHAGARLLDYGCGDGTFLAMTAHMFSTAVGTDADVEQLTEAAARLRSLANVAFLPPAVLDSSYNARFAVVTCMEVLEHCLPAVRAGVIGELDRLVSRDGRIVVSVPIETGLTLPAKQAARRIAGWRNLGDYRNGERYTWRELLTMTTADAETAIARPVYYSGAPARGFHGHKGFNWRTLESDLRRTFDIEALHFSPMPLLGPLLNSQVWFVCRPK
jgi:SAM-dependent methyltransferase